MQSYLDQYVRFARTMMTDDNNHVMRNIAIIKNMIILYGPREQRAIERNLRQLEEMKKEARRFEDIQIFTAQIAGYELLREILMHHTTDVATAEA